MFYLDLLGCLNKGLVGVDWVSGHGQHGTVQLLELLHAGTEGGDGLGVDKVHGVENEDNIFLALVVLETDMADLTVDNGMGGEVGGRARGLKNEN